MWRISLENLRRKPGRFIATLLAVLVGTGFLSTALILRDSLGPALADSELLALQNVSAGVLPPERDGNRAFLDTYLPADDLARVADVSGVSQAAGVLTGPMDLLGSDGKPARSGSRGRMWITANQLNPFTIEEGSPPLATGQIAIDRDTATDLGIGVGARVQLSTTAGPKAATVSGISRFGTKVAFNARGDILVADPDAFALLASGQQQYSAIYVAADADVAPQTVVDNIKKVVGANLQVLTGDQLRQEQAAGSQGLADAIGTGLQIFAYVALFVAIFIIYNTFSIIVAQRTREFALLRAVGATAKQVKRALRVEATMVGLIASILGIVLGIALFEGLAHFVPQFASVLGNSGAGLVVSVGSVIQVLVSGLIITLLSAVVPGWRAGRTAPVAAMRAVAIDRSSSSRFRMVVGTVLLALGTGLVLLSAATKNLLPIAFGTPIAFLGVLVGGPVLAGWFGSAAGWVLTRVGKEPSHLAVENIGRNASRTATTANALVIGVFMVVFVTAAGGAVRDSVVNQLSQFIGADLTVAAEGNSGIPAEVASKVQSAPNVSGTAPVWLNFAPPVGKDTSFSVGATNPAEAQQYLGVKFAADQTKPATALKDDQVAVATFPGAGNPSGFPSVGETFEITFPDGTSKPFTATTTFEFSFSVPAIILMPQTALEASAPGLQPSLIGVSAEPGQTESVTHELEAITAGYSNVVVQAGNQFSELIRSFFNFLISAVNILLGVAIVIALFGIVNTLILSILERTREIGLLRAVGMTRLQLRRMIRVEAILVSMLGTVVGLLFGLFIGWAITRPLFEQGGEFEWPVGPIIAVLILGVAIGLISSLLPAWRASRMDVLESITDF